MVRMIPSCWNRLWRWTLHLLDRHQEENLEEVGRLPKEEQEADRVVPVAEMEAIEWVPVTISCHIYDF